MKNRMLNADFRKLADALHRDQPAKVKFDHPRLPNAKPIAIEIDEKVAFSPPPKDPPKDVVLVGGLPIRKTKRGPVVPALRDIRDLVALRPWRIPDWKRWWDLINNDCKFVPQKTSRVEIPVVAPTRMCRVSEDCARVYTVNDFGQGCVVNVVTEMVENTFTVIPDPSASYPGDLPGAPVVNPFTKGGINHKYKRLYVPASFYSETRTGPWGGFYVAVVDVDPVSATYLQTIDYVDCGWVPEEVSFTADGETGVIANYMQGTVTIFRASDGSVLAQDLDCFDGAGGNVAGGPWARSVRIANVPGKGNRAFVTLTDSTPVPGVAIIDLDDPNFGRTNFTHSSFGFIDGVGITPDQRKILLVDFNDKLHVVDVDGASPSLDKSIGLPGLDTNYMAGIAVRPSGDMCFLATGSKDILGSPQGTKLVQVNYTTDTVLEIPNGLASQTWGVSIESFGDPLKPHIFVCSLTGMLTIIPC